MAMCSSAVKNISLILSFCLFCINSFSNNELLDSLKTSYSQSSNNCEKAKILLESIEILYSTNRDTVLTLCNKVITLTENNSDSNCIQSLGTAYNNIGVINDDNGHILDAIKAYEKSILIFDQVNYTKGIATSYTNIGYIYKSIHEYEKCLTYNKKALEYRLKIGNKKLISNSLNNIGYVHNKLENLDSALHYYQQSFQLREAINYERGMAFTLNNIGSIYKEKDKLDTSLGYFFKSLKLHRKTKSVLSNTMVNIAEIYLKKGNIEKSKLYADSAMELSLNSKIPERIKSAAEISYSVYEKLNDIDKAYYFQKLHYKLYDSLESKSLHDELIVEEAKFKYLKEHISDSISFHHKQEALNKLYSAEIAAEKQKSYYEFIGIIVLLVLVFILVIAYKIRRKSEIDLNTKNQELSVKNSQITRSINYANKIQNAVLDYDVEKFNNLFEHFILYKPKEIVSGDFYWFYDNGKNIYIGVADCSGHGVPGAFLSILGTKLLDEIISNNNELSPSEMLAVMNQKFPDSLNNNTQNVINLDSIDIAIIKIDKENNSFQWSSANRPLIQLKDNVVEVLKPKIVSSIGFHSSKKQIHRQNHSVQKRRYILPVNRWSYRSI